MPLFVLISGYFTRIKSTISFYKGIVKILIPLVFFQIVSLCLAYIFFDEIPGLNSLITPYWTLWYLLSLIFWRFILQFTPKRLINKPILYIFITFVLSLLGGLIDNGRVLSISRTLCFYPYFIIGYYIKNLKKDYPIVCNFPKKLLYLLVLFPLVFIVIGWYPSNSYLYLSGADYYGYEGVINKVVFTIVSLLMTLSIFTLRKDLPTSHILDTLGKKSLFIYLMHGLIIRFIMTPVAQNINCHISLGFVSLLMSTCVIIAFIFIISKNKFLNYIVYPLN